MYFAPLSPLPPPPPPLPALKLPPLMNPASTKVSKSRERDPLAPAPIEKTFYFQVFSDLHIEKIKKGQYYKIEPYADYLFLAGDIGNVYVNLSLYIHFFHYCSKRWKQVFYVCGNCEHHHYAHTNVYKKFFEEQKYDNVHYLHSSFVEIPDTNLIVYGATLWTNINIQTADHKYIPPHVIQRWSIHERDKLRGFLSVPRRGKKIIVLTHFPPIRQKTSAPEYDGESDAAKSYYAWDIYELLCGIPAKRLHNISAWICGHTHYSYMYSLRGFLNAVLISNPVGYLSYGEKTGFRDDAVFFIDCSRTDPPPQAAVADYKKKSELENFVKEESIYL